MCVSSSTEKGVVDRRMLCSLRLVYCRAWVVEMRLLCLEGSVCEGTWPGCGLERRR